MNTNANEMNMKELNLDEMEQVNGGSILCLLAVLGIVGGGIGLAGGLGYALRDSDIEPSNGIY